MKRYKLRLKKPSPKGLLTWALFAVGIWSLVSIGGFGDLRLNNLSTLREIFVSAFTPEVSPSYLYQIFLDSLTSLSYAITSMSLAVILGFVAGIINSGILFGKALALPGRLFLALFRSIHELIWALLFVQVLGLSPWSGILAIAIPYGGIMGRIFSDQLNDAPLPPVKALQVSGASKFSQFLYSRIPPMKGSMFSYLTYRFECAVRSAAVLSFVGLGGIGFRIQIALDDLDFSRAWTGIWALVILVAGFDFLFARAARHFKLEGSLN